MRRVIASLSLLGVTLFLPVAASAVGSSGFELALNSARSLARGNAVVADPEDSSTVVFNPAGLTSFDTNEITVTSAVIAPVMSYDGANGAVDGGISTPVVPIPATFVALNTFDPNLKLGLAANAPFGLKTQYDSTGNFKYTGYYNEYATIAYSASAAYRLAPWLSVGAGWSYIEADLKQVTKLNSNFITSAFIPGFTGLPDSVLELDLDGHGSGWNAGMILEPNEQHSIGVFYRSEIRTKLTGTVSVDDIAGPVMTSIFGGTSFGTSADTDVTLPGSITLGYSYHPNDQWAFEIDATWTSWSSFDRIDVAFDASNPVLDGLEPVQEDFSDSLSINVGAKYRIDSTWAVRCGYWYYEMAADEETYSNAIPDGDRHGISGGIQYSRGPYSIDLTYSGIIVTETEVDNSVGITNGATVDGEYSGVIHILTLGLSYRF